jgi:hypothetical protein
MYHLPELALESIAQTADVIKNATKTVFQQEKKP